MKGFHLSMWSRAASTLTRWKKMERNQWRDGHFQLVYWMIFICFSSYAIAKLLNINFTISLIKLRSLEKLKIPEIPISSARDDNFVGGGIGIQFSLKTCETLSSIKCVSNFDQMLIIYSFPSPSLPMIEKIQFAIESGRKSQIWLSNFLSLKLRNFQLICKRTKPRWEANINCLSLRFAVDARSFLSIRMIQAWWNSGRDEFLGKIPCGERVGGEHPTIILNRLRDFGVYLKLRLGLCTLSHLRWSPDYRWRRRASNYEWIIDFSAYSFFDDVEESLRSRLNVNT